MASINVQILGAGCDVGRSCAVVTLGDKAIMLDCGVHPGFSDKTRFPDFTSIPDLSKISLVLITHFHLDHAAALPYLTEVVGCNAIVYMTPPTKHLAELMLLDFIRTSQLRKEFCPFGEKEIEQCLQKVRLIDLRKPLRPPECPDVELTAFYAGHVLGAVMFRIVDEQLSILYSGDFSTTQDRHLRRAEVPPFLRPNLLISEATFCSTTRRGGRREQELGLMEAVSTAIEHGGKVLVPVSAFGRAQEICSILSAYWDSFSLRDTPVYFAEGLASRANSVYENFRDWCSTGASPFDTGSMSDEGESKSDMNKVLSRIRPFYRTEHWSFVTGREPIILFATPGNLSTGLSLDVFKLWSSDKFNLVVVPGFSVSNTVAGMLLGSGHSKSEDTTAVKCRLLNLSFSSHADAPGIIQTIECIKPDNIILVHSEKNKVQDFRRLLENKLRIPVHAPRNGDLVEIPCPKYKEESMTESRGQLSDTSENKDSATTPKHDVGHCELVTTYLSGSGLSSKDFVGRGYAERNIPQGVKMLEELQTIVGSELTAIGSHEYFFNGGVHLHFGSGQNDLVVEWISQKDQQAAQRLLLSIDKIIGSSDSKQSSYVVQ